MDMSFLDWVILSNYEERVIYICSYKLDCSKSMYVLGFCVYKDRIFKKIVF